MKVSRYNYTVIIEFDNVQSAEKVEAKYKSIEKHNKMAVAWCKRQMSEIKAVKRGGIDEG